MKNIRRRKNPQSQAPQQALDPCVEVGRFGLDGEVHRLRRDKQVLMVELVKLRQQQQNTRSHLQSMETRLKRTEYKQKQMMSFLARAMQNPNFVQQLVQQKEWRKELEEAISKKRRRPIDQGPGVDVDVDVEVAELGCAEECSAFVKLEQQEYNDMSELEVCDLDLGLAMNMEEQSGSQMNIEEKAVEIGSRNEGIEDVFWEGFMNEGQGGEEGLLGFKEDDENHINALAEELGYLASKS